ncbi:MAG TPA: 2-C-methyl-D-erythritol 4-phosphate cytidylyltransferase [Firmicutes bacterium]|nr:2-C-methyl-D-erythritol 4-phosphate cytidylyltransferase [Bacillota bacterium]
MKIGCAIVAGGRGTRLGEEWVKVPKAIVPLLGRPMLYYSLHAFDQIKEISRISVAVPKGETGRFEKLIRIWGFSKKIEIVEGGETRSESVFNALSALASDPPDYVLIHDAARPCVTPDMIDALLESESAATLAHPASDTLREVNMGTISGEIDRSDIINIETPQMFPYKKILELHKSGQSGGELPDDTTLFTRAGESVKVVFHDDSNIKVTWREDISAAEGILFGREWSDVTEGED